MNPVVMLARMTSTQLNQANPVSGTEYTVLEASNIVVHEISADVTWNVDTTTLEVHVYFDDVKTMTFSIDPDSGTNYWAEFTCSADDTDLLSQSLAALDNLRQYQSAYLFHGRRVKITAESTGGTANPLKCFVRYSEVEA